MRLLMIRALRAMAEDSDIRALHAGIRSWSGRPGRRAFWRSWSYSAEWWAARYRRWADALEGRR